MVRRLEGSRQSSVSSSAVGYCRTRGLPWKFKTWEDKDKIVYVMRVDGLTEEQIRERVSAFDGPPPQKGGYAAPPETLVVDRDHLSPCPPRRQSPSHNSPHKWHLMNVGDARFVTMVKRDLKFFLSKFLVNHPECDWQFTCERDRDAESEDKSYKQHWIVTRTK